MNVSQSTDPRSAKTKKGGQPALANPGHSGPTTFFLKTEKEMEKSTQRGRTASRSSVSVEDSSQKTPMASLMGDSSFGVQSLEETISSTFSSSSSLSRTTSNSTEPTSEADAEGTLHPGKKRRPNNRVHPTILATGQRIISSERPFTQASSGASPELTGSPLKNPQLRRSSATSSANMSHLSQPLTPIRLSPHPQSATPSEPRSPKSFRLSDEEGSVADDTSSQAILSSESGDEDEEPRVERTPQLVMPSLAMPSRRPFTEQGRQMGRTKIMVMGPKSIGKSSLINSILRSSEHIVHIDPVVHSTPSHSFFNAEGTECEPIPVFTETQPSFTEIQASTRPFPAWWTDFESRRMLHRRKSIGEGVLERNLTFIDTPGFGNDVDVQRMLDHINESIRRTARLDSMGDRELVSVLSGDGGVSPDAVIYLFDPTPAEGSDPAHFGLSTIHQELIQSLCKWRNFIPVIARADMVTTEALALKKQQIGEMLDSIKAEPYKFSDFEETTLPLEPFAVSSALEDDTDVLDASILMSSQYMQPLLPSELGHFVDCLLTPDNIARMRHMSAVKFVLWRQGNLGYHIGRTLSSRAQSPGDISLGSVDPSKVLVPHSSSSYYRAASPAISDNSSRNAADAGLPRFHEQPSEPFRQVRLAKWAQDLQRSLDHERRKYLHMFTNDPSDWSSGSSEKDDRALVMTKDGARPARGRLGGDLGVIDPRDPLGVLAFGQAFRRRGYFMLQIVGGCGLLGAVAYWIMRNWADVQDYFGIAQPPTTMQAVPAPTPRNWLENNFRGFFGWR